MNSIPPKIFETFGPGQLKTLEALEGYLKANKIDYIKCSSSGRLSKYYNEGEEGANRYPIKVVREQPILQGKNFIQNINEATDLFEKFSKSHRVNRIHCEFDELEERHKKAIRELANSV